jgi:hypothetical protein
MLFASLLAPVRNRLGRSQTESRRASASRQRIRPLLESLEDRTLLAGSVFSWINAAGGNWNDPTNWALVGGTSTQGFPNAPDDVAQLGPVKTGIENPPINITIPAATIITVGKIDFDGPAVAYYVAGGLNGVLQPGSLVFSTSGGPAAITMEPPASGGTVPQQEIGANIMLDTSLSITNATPTPATAFIPTPDLLVLSGDISDLGGTSNSVTLTAGTIKFSGIDTYSGPTTIIGPAAGQSPVDFVVGPPQGITQMGSLTSEVILTPDSDATLNGNGSVGGIEDMGGTVSPSGRLNSTGDLISTGDVTFAPAANLTTNINQSGVGDILSAPNNTVNLNGTTLLGVPSVAFAGFVGQTLDIVHAANITGTFNSLPDGTIFNVDGFLILIHYTSTDVTLTLQNDKLVTAWTSFIATPNPSTLGQGFTLSGNVATVGSSIIPVGNVHFTDQTTGNSLGTVPLDPSGNVSLNVPGYATADARLIQAVYLGTSSGDPLFAGNYAYADQQVDSPLLANPIISLSSAVNPSNPGDTVQITATVRPASGTNPVPRGRVDFFEGLNLLGQKLISVNGTTATATINLHNLPSGLHTILAVYSGNEVYNPIGATIVQNVLFATSTSVGGTPNPSNPNQAVTFTATVSGGSVGNPGGSVTFFADGTNMLGSGNLALVGGLDQASISTSTLSSGNHTITAIYSGDNTTFATSLGQTSQDVLFATSTSVGGSPNPSNPNQAVTFTATVSGGSGGTPGGSVDFFDGSNPIGSGTLAVVGGLDQATITTSSLSSGNHTITATYQGDNVTFAVSSGMSSQDVLFATTTTVKGGPDPSNPNQAVTFTATVSAGSAGTPGGSVNFFAGSTPIGSATLALVGGLDQATVSVSTLPSGNNTITATYQGDNTTFAASSGMTNQDVLFATTTKVSGSPNPSNPNQAVTFTATVSGGSAGTPGGTVMFFDGSTPIGSGTPTLIGGLDQATFTTSSLAPGDHTIAASYEGDNTTFATSSGSVVQRVLFPTTTLVNGNPPTSVDGELVTITAVVSGGSFPGTPGNTVTFFDGSTNLGTASLAVIGGVDQASVTVALTGVGPHTITANYTGDASFATSSGNYTQTVIPVPPIPLIATTTTVSGIPNPSVDGQVVTITAFVSAVNSPGTPGNTVTFLDGSKVLGTATLSLQGGVNQASITVALEGAGSHTIFANYGGDGKFAASSGSYTQVVNPELANQQQTSTSITSSLNPAFPGESVTFTVVVNVPSGVPTQTVTFTDNGTVLGTVGLGVVGGLNEATLTTSALKAGHHVITASYSGDSNFLPSAASLNERIKPEPLFAVGAAGGGGPEVRVFDARTGALLYDFMAFDPHFLGGVRVAVGDVNGDGVEDIVVGAGPGGGPEVRVFDGRTGGAMLSFMAYDPNFQGGVTVATGDLNGDGFGQIITGADAGGGPHVKVFSGQDGSLIRSFFAYDPNFAGGVWVAAGDMNGDGRDDIITGAGPGGGPHVEVFSGADNSVLGSWFAYDPNFHGGIFVGVGDVNGDGHADIITGAGAGGGPHVVVFSGADGSVLQSFMAYDPRFAGGVRVAAVGFQDNGQWSIITGAGAGGGPHMAVWDATTLTTLDSFFAYDPLFTGGIFVGGD